MSTNCFCIPKINIVNRNIDDLTALWNLQIISDVNQPQITTLEITASSNNTVLYEGISENFMLQPGVFNFQGNQSNTVITKYITSDLDLLSRSKDIRVTIVLYNPVQNIELSRFTETVLLNGNLQQADSSSSGSSKRDKIKKYFDAAGMVELNGVYNTRKDTLFYLPTDYFRVKVHTSLSIYDIPFTYDMFVTTEQKYTDQKLNSYSFKFDVQAFKRNMVSKVSNKIGSVEDLMAKKDSYSNFNTGNILDSLKSNKSLSQDYITKYKEFKSLDTLKNALGFSNDVDMKKSITQLKKLTNGFDSAKIDSLKKKYNVKREVLQKVNEIKHDATQAAGQLKEVLTADTILTVNDTSGLSFQTFSYDSFKKRDSISLDQKSDTIYKKIDSVQHTLGRAHNKLDSLYSKGKDSITKYLALVNEGLSSFSANPSSLSDNLFSKDTSYSKADSTIKSLLERYEKASSIYGNNPETLSKQLKKVDKYSVDDLAALSKINHAVSEKIEKYKIQENAKELSKLKGINAKDFNDYTSNKQIYSMLGKYNLMSKKEMLLNNIRSLDVGTVFPYYSSYTIDGVIMLGYNLAYNYKQLYVGATGGKQLNVFNDSILQGHRLKKNLLFGFVMGYGDKNSNHLHLNYVYGKREIEVNSISPEISKLENHVLAPDFRWSFIKGKLTVSGEAPVSLTKNIGSEFNGNAGKFEIGYAGKLNVVISPFKNNTIQLNSEYADRHFTSYGVAFLLKNYLQSSFKMTQKVSNYLKIEAGYKLDNYFEDDERGMGSARIHTLLSAASLTYKVLTINATYSPGWLESNMPARASTRLTTASLTINTNYKLKKAVLMSQVGASYSSFYNTQLVFSNTGVINIENNIFDINRNLNVYLVQSMTYNKKYILSMNLSYLNNRIYATQMNNIIITACTFAHLVNKKIRYSVLAQLVNDLKNSKRYTLQGSVSCRINKYLELNAKLQYDYLKGIVRENFYQTNGFQVSTGAIVRF